MNKTSWLRPAEIELRQRKFRGKLAGKSWKYASHLDNLSRTRAIIFGMALLVFFPVLNRYFILGEFSVPLLIQRAVFSVVLIVAGLLFNKLRIFAMVLAMLPLILIIAGYLFIPGQFDIRIIGFMGAILTFIGLGIYHHIKAEQLRKELEKNTPEAHLVDNA